MPYDLSDCSQKRKILNRRRFNIETQTFSLLFKVKVISLKYSNHKWGWFAQ